MSLKLRYHLILFFIFFPLYFFRLFLLYQKNYQPGELIKITSRLKQEPQLYSNYQVFKIDNFIIQARKEQLFHYYDKLEIIGKVELKEKRKFFKIYILKEPEIRVLESSHTPLKFVYQFRHFLEKRMVKLLPQPQANLLLGIILGLKKEFNFDFYQAMIKTGVLHLIVASGMNVSLLAGNFKELLAHFLNRKKALFLSFFIIIFYCFLSGAHPPIVRASLMASIYFLSQYLGREETASWSLLLASSLMLVFSPRLIFDLGFQLSFLATLGMILFSQTFTNWFGQKKLFTPVSAEAGETFSVIFITLPFLLVVFGRFNLLSLIPNLLIIPLVPYVFYLGLLVSFLSIFFLPLAQFFSFLLWMPLTYFVFIIKFFGSFDFLDFRIKNFSWALVFLYYLIILIYLIRKDKKWL